MRVREREREREDGQRGQGRAGRGGLLTFITEVELGGGVRGEFPSPRVVSQISRPKIDLHHLFGNIVIIYLKMKYDKSLIL